MIKVIIPACIQPTEDGKNFTGLVGDLSNDFTDIGWANLFIRDDRRAIMDFTDTYRDMSCFGFEMFSALSKLIEWDSYPIHCKVPY